jgi:hypothetical protein
MYGPLIGSDPFPGMRSTSGTGLTPMLANFTAAAMPAFTGATDNLATGTEAAALMQNPFGELAGMNQGAMAGLDGTAMQDSLGSMLGTYMQLMQFAQQMQMACMQEMMQTMGQNGLNGGLNANGNNGLDGGGGGNNAVDGGGGGGAIDGLDNNVIPNTDGKVNLAPHGGWAGTQGPVQELVGMLGKGFSVSSAKRATQMTASGNVSDHYIGNKTAYANDIVWGSSTPNASSDAAASKLIQSLGGPANWGSKGGVFNKVINGVRYQVLYKTNVGGNHFNHIHLGAKKV